MIKLHDFWGLELNDLKQLLDFFHLSQNHAENLFKSLYRINHPFEIASKKVEKLFDTSHIFPIELDQCYESEDGSTKFVFKTLDNLGFESVLMPEKSRYTLCVSSQVGCKRACAFCQTGKMGLIRNLSAAEIISQLVYIELIKNIKISNVVFMGMGEPCDNLESVRKAISIMLTPIGLNLAPRKITLSSVGKLDGLYQFLEYKLPVAIAISLHSVSSLRSKLMPITKEFSLVEIRKFIDYFESTQRKSLLIQYTLMESINDQDQDALELSEYLKGTRSKINLIPMNPIAGTRFKACSKERAYLFANILLKNGFRTMIRWSKGPDIGAACGQLVRNKLS